MFLKKIIIIFSLFFISTLIFSTNEEDKWGTITCKGGWGYATFKNTKTILQTSCKYKNILSFSEGLGATKKDGKWGYINKREKVMIPYQFAGASKFKSGQALVLKEEEEDLYTPYFINKKGKKISYFYNPSIKKTNFKNGDILYIFAQSGLNIRNKNNLSAKKIGLIPYGSNVKLLKDTQKKVSFTFENIKGYWAFVQYKNKKGYVFSGFLSQLKPPKVGISLDEYIKKNYQLKKDYIHTFIANIYSYKFFTNHKNLVYEKVHKSLSNYTNETFYLFRNLVFSNVKPYEVFLVLKSIFPKILKNQKFKLGKVIEVDTKESKNATVKALYKEVYFDILKTTIKIIPLKTGQVKAELMFESFEYGD